MRAFVKDVLPRLAPYDTAVIVNVCGDTVEEYAEVTRIVDDAPGVAAVEINISCPNVKDGRDGLRRRSRDDRTRWWPRSGSPRACPSSPSSPPTSRTSRCSRGWRRRRARTRSPASTRVLGLAVDVEAPPAAPGLRHRGPLRPRHPSHRRAHGLAGGARGPHPRHRHRRDRQRRRRAGVPDGGLPRGAGRHGQLRGPRGLRPHPLRTCATTWSATACATSTPWSGGLTFPQDPPPLGVRE